MNTPGPDRPLEGSPAKEHLGRLCAEAIVARGRDGERTPIHQVLLRFLIVIRDSCGAGSAA